MTEELVEINKLKAALRDHKWMTPVTQVLLHKKCPKLGSFLTEYFYWGEKLK